MTQIQAPTFEEILQVCDFAESRIETIEHDAKYGDAEPLSDWEASCLGKVWNWVKQLQKSTPEQTVQMANETLTSVSSLEVRGMLTLSTAHITSDAADWLVCGAGKALVSGRSDYGWFIPIVEGGQLPAEMPASVEDVLGFTSNLGCKWLNLDRDGPIVESLTQYDW